MEGIDDLDVLASLLEENEEETETLESSLQEEPSLEQSNLEEEEEEEEDEERGDQWDDLFDAEGEGVSSEAVHALFGDIDDLEEEEDESDGENTTEIPTRQSPSPEQKKSETSKQELEAELERMKQQMERLQQRLSAAKSDPGPSISTVAGKASPRPPPKKLRAPEKSGCNSQKVHESRAFQEAMLTPSSKPRNGLLKNKPQTSRSPPQQRPAPGRTSPTRKEAGCTQLPQPLKSSNKTNITVPKLPTTTKDRERPGPSGIVEQDIAVDRFSGLRIRNPLVSSTEMERKMQSRKMIRLSQLRSKLATENLEATDWVTFGVVCKKTTPQSSSNGKTFSIWRLTDLCSSSLNLSLFLFGNVHKEHWKTETGTVIGLLNANPMKPKEGSEEVCLSVDHPQKILVMGEAMDMGCCRARKKNGEPCTQIVNLRECGYCEYHVKAQYKKLSAKRADLQSSFSGHGPRSGRGKPGNLKERLCHQGFHYGGVSSASYAASVTAAGPKRSVQTTLSNMVVRGADMIVKETRQRLALANGKSATSFTGEFEELMEAPSFGARNLKKHLSKSSLAVSNAQPGSSILSISASDLLKQQRRKILETRKKRTEELQKSFMQSAGGAVDRGSGTGTPSPLASPRVGAGFPKEQTVTATSQAPRLGRGFAEGDDILFFESSLPSAAKSSGRTDSKKIAAVSKLREKGTVLAKEDPNCVKRKLCDLSGAAAKVAERVEQSLSSPAGGEPEPEEPSLKKRRERLEYLESQEFQQILNARSRHIGAVQEAEIEIQEQYFEPLVKKEQMEDKMRTIREMECRVVTCKTCKYTHFKPLETCVAENHDYHWHDALKRFFKCPCGNRVISLSRLPSKSCRKCGLFKWERDGMMKERKGPKIGGELLLPRGEEHGKFINSAK
ncbi:protein MCM10 homolog isoform X2 [Callorhinchus milii]|uniref:protein MCM10 homolog isoform X2 n=1 Tax=Callorhinchus milii TaxID=7868 RepID=UPI001C3FA667|nr:protein MCM10 homolog isoform X2 [Callorhinchus milii]